MEEAPREISRYSIAFAKANHKCGTVVQFYDNDTILPVGDNPENRFLAGVEIVNPGSGYTTPPTINVGSGVICASVVARVNAAGRISEVVVVNRGRGTTDNNSPISLTIVGENQTATLRPIEGGCVVGQKDAIRLEYTDQNYSSPSITPKTPPYPNIGNGPAPDEDDYITGGDYIRMVGDGNGNPGSLGTGKRITDLPACVATPQRVDVIPSIAQMSFYKPGGRCVKNIIVEDGGSGYVLNDIEITIEEPTAVDETDEPLDTNITAEIDVENIVIIDGRIISVELIESGMGYITPPTITINTGITQAVLTANLCGKEENTMRFDAYVFGGNNPSQLIIWESSQGTLTTEPRTGKGDVTLPDTGIFKPSKTAEATRIPIVAKMYATPAVSGEASLYLTPEIMSDWPTLEKGYTSGRNIPIRFWVFGGGIGNHNLTVRVHNSSTDPSSSNFNASTNMLIVGSNEAAKYLTIEVTSTPELEPLIFNIYRKYIQITSDEDGNDIVEHHIISTNYGCGEEIQFYAWSLIDDRTEYETFNYTHQDVTEQSNWTVSGNTLPETRIEDGLLTLGIRDTVYQPGFIVPSGQFIHVPGAGEVTSIKVTNGGENYDSTFQTTITSSNGNVIELGLEVDSGRITGVTILSGNNTGFTPLDEIVITLPTPPPTTAPSGFRYELVIDKHLEVGGVATVFMRECERGNIRINVNHNGVVGSTRNP
jgi:hypothetical protein